MDTEIISLQQQQAQTSPGADLIEVGDDFVEHPNAFQPLSVSSSLLVEVLEVGHGGEHDAGAGVGLVVQLLVLARGAQEVCCHVRRQDVLQQQLVHVRSDLDLFCLALKLQLPRVAQPVGVLDLNKDSRGTAAR